MNKIVRIAALAAVVGTAILSYSLPQSKTSAPSLVPQTPWIPPTSK